MKKKPLIGLTLDLENNKSYSKFPWYAIRQNYCSAISNMGGIPIPLVYDINSINTMVEKLDGFVITGGAFDINPSYFSEKTKFNNLGFVDTNFAGGNYPEYEGYWDKDNIVGGSTANSELTHNWGTENDDSFSHHDGNSDPRGFGHIGITVPDVYKACERFESLGAEFQKKPDDGNMKGLAFIKDPDGYWIEILSAKGLASTI